MHTHQDTTDEAQSPQRTTRLPLCHQCTRAEVYEWVGSCLGESGRGGARLSEYLDDDGRLVMSKKEGSEVAKRDFMSDVQCRGFSVEVR